LASIRTKKRPSNGIQRPRSSIRKILWGKLPWKTMTSIACVFGGIVWNYVGSDAEMEILLMEEILHHPTCRKPC